ncbi:glycosyl hydrolase family 65 protein [Pseudomonas sp. P7759]|uniref:glycosyl hydrolase family 65 protein n=1 Tax=Pseudomonas sp. P7759 TaxID=2738831 RepID=UPI001C432186|nr:glycosyl hydrolase family 65 protein [Pseudomonas sp. P7759]
MAGLYAPGVGVAREIVALPAPRILRLYDVDTGVLAADADEEPPRITLSMDSASVSSTQQFRISDCVLELMVRQFIDRPDQPAISTVISLRKVGGRGGFRRVRIDYGVDACALNEYLGASPWLTARHYELGAYRRRGDGFDVTVQSGERTLRYGIQMQSAPARFSSLAVWGIENACCAGSVTFDFAKVDRQLLFTRWQISSAAEVAVQRALHPALGIVKAEADHRHRWAKIWQEHDVTIEAHGHPVELGIRYAVFQLLQQGLGAPEFKSGLISPARGLSSTYHSGATFFDTELHKFEFWLWNAPDVARALIDFRHRTLQGAWDFARATGFAGARFPEASNDLGLENGPRYVLSYPGGEVAREWSVDEVLHISADVAYAVARYWAATGDQAYMEAAGYALISDCARFAVSAFKWSVQKSAYVIGPVMGPDEYHYHVNNSFFTNYLLRWCITYALSWADRGFLSAVHGDELSQWRNVSKQVYLPWMTADGISIPEEFEGYADLPEAEPRTCKGRGPRFADELERVAAQQLMNFDSNVVKQADVILLMSMFADDFPDEVKRAAFNFYEPRTVHESSLSYGPHARVAADIGALDKCADFITKASRYNLDFTPTDDYSNGLHLSAYAGAWQGLVQGVAGLRVDDELLSLHPKLPSGWQSYRFVICFRGKRFSIDVRAQGAALITVDGKEQATTRDSNGRLYIGGVK